MNTATFSSTMLVNITSNDPKEISDQVNKALNDVLSKLNNLSNSINTTQTQAQATYAPLPQSAAGVGQIIAIELADWRSPCTPAGRNMVLVADIDSMATDKSTGATSAFGISCGEVPVQPRMQQMLTMLWMASGSHDQ